MGSSPDFTGKAPKAEIRPRAREATKFRVFRYPRPGKRVKETVYAARVKARPSTDRAQDLPFEVEGRVRGRSRL